MKERKRCLTRCSFYDHEGIARKLEDMAAQGWMLEEVGNTFWTYRRTEPKRLRFAVTYFPDASAFDPGPTEGELTREEFCARDGWQLVLRWEAMQIFCNENLDAVPIETDPVAQVENIRRTMWKRVLVNQLVELVLVVVLAGTQFSSFRLDPTRYLSDSYYLFSTLFWLVVLVMVLYEIGFCLVWYRRARRAAEEGVFLSVSRGKGFSEVIAAVALGLLCLSLASQRVGLGVVAAWMVVLGLVGFAGRRIRDAMQRRGASRRRNQAVSIGAVVVLTLAALAGLTAVAFCFGGFHQGSDPVDTYEWDGYSWDIYDDELPLEVEDLAAVDARFSKRAEEQESFLLARTECSQRPLLTEDRDSEYVLEYTVVDVKHPFLLDFVRESMLRAHQDEYYDKDTVFIDHYEPVDPTIWGADRAYQLHWRDSVLDEYLVCWGNRLVVINFFWNPTPQQLRLAAERLHP